MKTITKPNVVKLIIAILLFINSISDAFKAISVVIHPKTKANKKNVASSSVFPPFSPPSLLSLSTTTTVNSLQHQHSTLKGKSKSVPIVACSSTIELQRAINFYIQPNDNVLELGSQLNEVSKFIYDKISYSKNSKEGTRKGSVVFADIKRKDATSGRCKPRDIDQFVKNFHNDDKNIENISFLELEQFDQWRGVVDLNNVIDDEDKVSSSAYDVIILDVGTMIGNDLHLTALSIANEIIALQQLNPLLRLIIVKSKIMSNLARRIIHSQRLFDGSVVFPKPHEIARSSTPYIIAAVGVNEYRRTIPFVVQSGDEAIEVGCHFGQTTVLLHKATNTADNKGYIKNKGFCLGVDIGPKIIQHAKNRYPEVPFYVCNAWNTLQLLKIRYGEEIQSRYMGTSTELKFGYDLVYADIGGLSGADGLLESLSLLESIGYGMEPRVIVIKSLCVNRLASQLRAFSDIWSKIENKHKD